jgi:hypothetical protein
VGAPKGRGVAREGDSLCMIREENNTGDMIWKIGYVRIFLDTFYEGRSFESISGLGFLNNLDFFI